MQKEFTQQLIAAAFVKAGLEGVTNHCLHYSTAAILRELGVDMDERQALLGHSTVAMATKYSAQRRGAADAIAKMGGR